MPDMNQMTREELQTATNELSSKLLDTVFESEYPFVVKLTGLLTATIGFTTTALTAIKDEQAREQIAVHVGGMLLKSIETVMEAGGVKDAEDKGK